MQKNFIFLDRDGVINEDLYDYVTSPKDFKFIKGSLGAIANLTSAGYEIIVVTNQACIGSGIATAEQIKEVNEFMENEVAKGGGKIKKVLVCPHQQNAGCGCRKPETGLLVQAEKELEQNLKGIYFIGDKESDVRAALSFGCIPLLVLTGYGAADIKKTNFPEKILTFSDLKSASEYIIGNE